MEDDETLCVLLVQAPMPGIALGIFTLIWYKPTWPGVKPTKAGIGVGIGAAMRGLTYGRDGVALGRKSNWRYKNEESAAAGAGLAWPVLGVGLVGPKPKAQITISSPPERDRRR